MQPSTRHTKERSGRGWDELPGFGKTGQRGVHIGAHQKGVCAHYEQITAKLIDDIGIGLGQLGEESCRRLGILIGRSRVA